jgi:hypothetical protein
MDSDPQPEMKTNPGCATIWGVIALAVGGQAVAQAPTITGFAPTTGPANMVVVVSGTNFSAPLNFQNPFVLLNGQAAPVSSFSNNDLLFSVPALATSGPITVTTAFGPVTSNRQLFRPLIGNAAGKRRFRQCPGAHGRLRLGLGKHGLRHQGGG